MTPSSSLQRPDPVAYSIPANASILDAIKCIDRSLWISIALIVDERGRLQVATPSYWVTQSTALM